jgi:hypothetical protein
VATPWTVTVDCASPARLAAFWAEALGYAPKPPPQGFGSWEEWLRSFDVPEDEWDDGAALWDPDGVGPHLSFLRVPEPKAGKNRLHLDVQVGGGRHVPWDERWPRVQELVERLTAAGGTVLAVHDAHGRGDHVVMADPEGNEFCVL